jgi:hypothetical protein
MKKIIIVGSGYNKKLKKKGGCTYIFSNSSVLRAPKKFVKNLIISRSIIGEYKEMFQSKKNILGLDQLESNNIRRYKIECLKGIYCKELIVYAKKSNLIKERIKKIGIQFKYIHFISDLFIFFLLIKYINFRKIFNLFFFNKILFIKFVIKILISRRLISNFKPSTGAAAILWSKQKYPQSKIFIDGIGCNKQVYYPIKNKLIKFRYNLSHRKIDKLIIKTLLY